MTKIILDPKLLTNKEKILFPKDKITKEQLADYYKNIAPYMLPFLKDRPITMQRFPDGITKEGFYQKNISEYFPSWIEKIQVRNSDGSKTNYVIVENEETLIYLAYQACITIHLWLSKRSKLNYPDRMIFDLDPGQKTTFHQIQKYALELKEFLEKLNLKSFPMLTGSRGIHVVVPIKSANTFHFVHKYAHDIAKNFTKIAPEDLTIEIRKEKREGKLFIDFIRNTYGHTAVAPYSVRPIEGAPIAIPLSWEEISDSSLKAQSYNIFNVFEYLKKHKETIDILKKILPQKI